MRRRVRHRVVIAAALPVLFVGALIAPVGAGAASGENTGSAVTRAGTGAFAGLKVTVDQTRNLINQAVRVTWTGGAPTQPAAASFGTDFLQIMQCWGGPAGPEREQCEFGAKVGDQRGSPRVSSRQVNYGDTLVDPAETYRPAPGSLDNVFVPFRSFDGGSAPGAPNQYFDAATSNEVPFGRTLPDGTGEETFEVQTIQEAPGLGCGGLDASKSPRSCWLVVVPRNDLEVDGSRRTAAFANRLESSPLSATNWANRIVFPLGFEPVDSPCDFSKERRIVGQEAAEEAMSRWQPALCGKQGVGVTYGFSRIPDYRARDQLVGDAPGMVLVSDPVPPADVPADRALVYAPVAVNATVVAFLIERVPGFDASEQVQNRAGSKIDAIKLSPRLLAKLMTQSYQYGSPPGNPALRNNPPTIAGDPEFDALNPEFADLFYVTLGDAVVPLGRSDAALQIWRYIAADPKARDFVAGIPDEFGMVVNPDYKGLTLPTDDFPKGDQYCQTFVDERQPLCALDWRPYAADFHSAAQAAARGDNLARVNWDVGGNPPTWKASGPAGGGSRAVLAITDAATARRYGLSVAELRNGAGQYVTPTESAMTTAVAPATAQPSLFGSGWQPDVAAVTPGGYPLTSLTYAVTAPAVLSPPIGADYAKFLRYAAGAGQTPGVGAGTLPFGYLPLPPSARTVTATAADVVQTTAGVPLAPAVPETPDSTTVDTSGSPTTVDTSGAGGGAGDAAPQSVTDTLPGVQPGDAVASASVAKVSLVTTPSDPSDPTRFLLLGCLVVGAVAGLAGTALIRLSGRRGGIAPVNR